MWCWIVGLVVGFIRVTGYGGGLGCGVAWLAWHEDVVTPVSISFSSSQDTT